MWWTLQLTRIASVVPYRPDAGVSCLGYIYRIIGFNSFISGAPEMSDADAPSYLPMRKRARPEDLDYYAWWASSLCELQSKEDVAIAFAMMSE